MKKQLLSLAGLLFLLASCDSPLGDSGITLEPLEGKVLVAIRERLIGTGESQPQPVLEIQTEKHYPCANNGIYCEPRVIEKTFEFILKGVTVGSVCLTAFGPASYTFPLDFQNGTYVIRIRIENTTSIHTLVVTDSAYHLSGSDTGISKPVDTLFWRFRPRSFSYGCNYYSDMNDGWVCQGFLDTLRKSVSLKEFYPPADGEWPYWSYSRYFEYSTEGDFVAIEETLKEFSKRYLNNERSATINIINWRNKHLGSWILKDQ